MTTNQEELDKLLSLKINSVVGVWSLRDIIKLRKECQKEIDELKAENLQRSRETIALVEQNHQLKEAIKKFLDTYILESSYKELQFSPLLKKTIEELRNKVE